MIDFSKRLFDQNIFYFSLGIIRENYRSYFKIQKNGILMTP